jgi:hypothetical protein
VAAGIAAVCHQADLIGVGCDAATALVLNDRKTSSTKPPAGCSARPATRVNQPELLAFLDSHTLHFAGFSAEVVADGTQVYGHGVSGGAISLAQGLTERLLSPATALVRSALERGNH